MARQETRHAEAPNAHDLRKRVGANIALAQGDLKNRELADKIGIDVRLLQKHKAGDNMPSDDNLLKYARVLGRSVAWFFEVHEPRPEVVAA